MTPDELKQRTKALALRVLRLVDSLPRGRAGDVIGRQLLRSATGIGANYRSACRSRTNKDFLARMGIVEEEADEVLYWLELLVESGVVRAERLADLHDEAEEVLKIVVASIKTARKRSAGPVRNPKSTIRNSQPAR